MAAPAAGRAQPGEGGRHGPARHQTGERNAALGQPGDQIERGPIAADRPRDRVAAADGRGDTVTAQFPTGERTLTVVGTYDNRALLGDRLVE